MSIESTLKEIGAAMVALAVVVVVLSTAFPILTDIVADGSQQTAALTTSGGTGTLALSAGETVARHDRAQTSLGTGVELADGATVTGTGSDLDTQRAQWSVCTYAQPAPASDNVTSTLIAYDEAAIIHNGTSDTYRGYFFDHGNRSAVAVDIPVNGTATPTLVCLTRDNATITVSRNASAAASVQLGSDSDATPPPNTGFNGTVDETRVYDRTLTDANKSTIVADPTGAIRGEAPVLRVTYDARTSTQDTFRGFFAGTTVDASGATIVDSFAGEAITSGTDYEFGGTQNATLTVLDGGALRPTGEIVYATFSVNTFGGILNSLIRIGGAALGLLVLGVLLLAAREVTGMSGGSF